MADEHGAVGAHVVGAAGLPVGDLVRAVAGAAVETALSRAVASVEAPGLREQHLNCLRRKNTRSVKRPAIEQHAPDAGEAARGDAKPALRRE